MPQAIGVRLAFFYASAFTATGVFLPFWPVWLEAQGLSPAEIGYVLAAGFWPRVVSNLVIARQSDHWGERKRLMAALAGVTLIGLALFALVDRLAWFLALSVLTGASWASILPLGEALVLNEAKRVALDYGRIRLWGSLAFILTAIGAGLWLERSGPPIVLGLLLGAVGLTMLACLLLPEDGLPTRHDAPPRLRRLLEQPGFLGFIGAAGLIQVSHAVYYGFATLHWRAAGYGETTIGWLWAEAVVAEVLLFWWAGALLRRLDPVRLLAVAGALAVLRWLLTASSVALPTLLFAQSLHAASFGAVHLAAMHYLRDTTPAELQASAQGVYAAFGYALPFGLITPVAGWLYGIAGGAAFFAMAALALLGTVLVALVPRPRLAAT
jgi:PPP family 3-phenylpropionic acid transporter